MRDLRVHLLVWSLREEGRGKMYGFRFQVSSFRFQVVHTWILNLESWNGRKPWGRISSNSGLSFGTCQYSFRIHFSLSIFTSRIQSQLSVSKKSTITHPPVSLMSSLKNCSMVSISSIDLPYLSFNSWNIAKPWIGYLRHNWRYAAGCQMFCTRSLRIITKCCWRIQLSYQKMLYLWAKGIH